MTTRIHAASAGYDTYSGMWVPRGVGRVERVVGPPPEAQSKRRQSKYFNPLNPELNPICYLLALLAHHFLHVSRIRVKSLTLKLLMSYYIWSAYY